jgi:hypothetical protein
MLATITLAVFALLLGAAFCFVGYRFFLVMLPIWGFFGGFWIGAYVTSLILGSGFLATTTALVVGVAVGIFGAVLSYLFYMLGVLIIAGLIGGALASGIMTALGFGFGLIPGLIILASALVAAGLTLFLNLQKLAIILLTAMGGASLCVLAGLLLIGQVTVAQLQSGLNFLQPVFQGSWLWSIVWLALAIVGALFQLRAHRGYEFQKEMFVEGWG